MEIFEILKQRLGESFVLRNEPMKNHITFRVGGPADVFATPQSVEDLLFIIQACREGGVPYFVIGNGSNLLVRDGGIRGVVVSMAGLREVRLLGGDKIYAQAGAMMPDVSKFAYDHGLSGLEFAEGIPGSIGGGVVMNAGAFGAEIKDVFCTAQVIDNNCKLIDINLQEMDFGYRKSAAQARGYIICGVTMQPAPGDKAAIAANMADYRGRRRDKQPLAMPSAGSTFKRPSGHFAGKLIMDAGLRGTTVGGAQVSEKHCGFIVNTGGATAEDVLDLIEQVQATVAAKFGVMLELEVKVVGEVSNIQIFEFDKDNETHRKQLYPLVVDYFTELLTDDEAIPPERMPGLFEQIVKDMDFEDSWIFLGYKDGEPMGFVMAQIDRPGKDWCRRSGWGTIREMYVVPHLRGQGLGRVLAEKAHNVFANNSVRDMYLTTDDAYAFWESLGYVNSGEVEVFNNSNIYIRSG